MKTEFTKDEILERRGCYEYANTKKLIKGYNIITLDDIINSSIHTRDKFWFIIHHCGLAGSKIIEIATDLINIILPLYEEVYTDDKRPRKALEIIKDNYLEVIYNQNDIIRNTSRLKVKKVMHELSDIVEEADYNAILGSNYVAASIATDAFYLYSFNIYSFNRYNISNNEEQKMAYAAVCEVVNGSIIYSKEGSDKYVNLINNYLPNKLKI